MFRQILTSISFNSRIFLFLIILVTVTYCTPQEKKIPPKVIGGVLDLTGWDFEKDGIVKLDGEWEFYWNEFLEPGESRSGVKYILVPGKWNDYLINDKEIGANGYASYRIKIKNTSLKNMGLKIHQVYSNYDLYINGKLIANSGKTGKTEATSGFSYAKKNIFIDDLNGEIEILIHVSNFLHARGGLRESNLIGAIEDLAGLREKKLYLDFFLFGSLFIMSLYHIGLFLLRKEDKSVLYFAIFSLLLAMRPLFVGEAIQVLFPEMNFIFLLKLEYLDLFLSPPFILLFLQSNFKEEFKLTVIRVFIILFFFLVFIVIFFPMKIYTSTITTFEIFLLCEFVYIFYSILQAIFKKREGSIIIFIGLLMIVIFTINDILFEKGFIQTGYFVSHGVFLFIFSQAYMLSVKFSSAFIQSEISRNYAEEQKKLAENRKLEIEKLNKAKDEFLANLSHELKTPLTYIYMYAEMLTSPSDALTVIEYAKEVYANAQKLNDYVEDLIMITDIESNIKLNFEEFPIGVVVEKEISKLKDLISEKKITIQCNVSESIFFGGDLHLISKTIHAIIKNAILYNEENGIVQIIARDNGDYLMISVRDTGIGIAKDYTNKIFEKFFRVDSSLNYEVRGVGVGLYLAKKIVDLHNGKMELITDLGRGSEFIITLPVGEKS